LSILRQVAGNSSWWLAERAATLLLTLLTNIVLVRVLGPAQFGELSYVLAVAGLLVPLTQFGVSGLVARALLERPDDEAAVLRAAMLLRLFGCALALVVGSFYWLFFEDRAEERWMLLVLLGAQFATTFQVVEFWFQVKFRASRLVPWRMGVVVAGAIIKMSVAVSTGDAQWVVAAFALELLMTGGAALLAMRRESGRWATPGWAPERVRWFALRAPWLLASGVAEVIYLRIDIVLLERLRGVEEAGIYAVAARLSEAWYMIPVALMGAAFPAIWQRRSDPAAYECSLQASLDLLCGLALALAIVIQLAGLPLIELLFGERFVASAPVLQIHVWAGLFVFMRALLSRWLLAEDMLRFSLLTHLAGAVVNVALNLLLIPTYGTIGAAVATVISYASAGWLALYLSARTRPMAHMMARALLLPLRWRDLAAYGARFRLELAASRDAR